MCSLFTLTLGVLAVAIGGLLLALRIAEWRRYKAANARKRRPWGALQKGGENEKPTTLPPPPNFKGGR